MADRCLPSNTHEVRKNATRRMGALEKDFFDKFSLPVSATEVKKFATNKQSNAELNVQEKVASETESTKRTKIACHPGKSISLRETRQYLKIKQFFDSKIKELKEIKFTKVECTRKIPSSKVDAELMNLIDSVIGDNVRLNPPDNSQTITQLAKCLQVAQQVYWAACSTKKERSPWKDNITKKIEKLEKSRELLSCVEKSGTLSSSKEARKAMRDLNFKCKPANIQPAIALLEERVSMYKRKLEVYQSRLEIRRETNAFELHRNKFYKNMTGGSTVNHSVPEKEIEDFWSNMRNEKEAKNTSYEEYLLECIPDQDDIIVFPTINEF
ncbi:hypothetical protein NUSPORA_02462 [Nucleospora cyclopteri]